MVGYVGAKEKSLNDACQKVFKMILSYKRCHDGMSILIWLIFEQEKLIWCIYQDRIPPILDFTN